jgi:hypothetical protein
VSHSAVDSDALFWLMVALTVLLGMLIGVVFMTPPETVGSPQPQAAGLAGAPARSARIGYRPRHAGGMRPHLIAAGRPQVSAGPPWESAGPPWEPAPWPPGLADRDAVPGPAHRHAPRHRAHRVVQSIGQERSPAGVTGRHRAGVH